MGIKMVFLVLRLWVSLGNLIFGETELHILKVGKHGGALWICKRTCNVCIGSLSYLGTTRCLRFKEQASQKLRLHALS